MKDNKPWYEKISIWVCIISGICGILGISVFGIISLIINNKQKDSEIIKETKDPLIQHNWDLIQQLKSEYLDEDINIIKSNSVFFKFYENAGYVYSDSIGTEQRCMLQGSGIVPSKMIILDYASDEVIYIFTPERSNYVRYSPENQESFYCVVFCENYDIYVTQPFHVVGSGDYYTLVDIFLNNKYDEYTPIFKIRTYKQELELDKGFYYCSSDYIVEFNCKNTYHNEEEKRYFAKVMDSGILSFNNGMYFSLNTKYTMNFSLYHKSNPNIQLANNVFDGFITNTNIVEIHFLFNNKNDTENQIE